MNASTLWTSVMAHNSEWTKISAAVVAGSVGVWSWATNTPDAETGKKNTLKSVVTLGALSTGAALGITRLTRTSIREAFRTVHEAGLDHNIETLGHKKSGKPASQSL